MPSHSPTVGEPPDDDRPAETPAVTTAHLDEATTRLPDGRRLYGIAAVLTSADHQPAITAALRSLLVPGRTYLHHYEETLDRRCRIAEALAELVIDGAIILTETTANDEQERARAQLVAALLPRLQYAEKVERVVIESRAGADKFDRRVRDRLRRSRHITADLRVDHAPKRGDVLLGLPDFVAGAWFSAEFHDEPRPWKILSAAHYIDVSRLRTEP